jgi:hypothetical protein
MFTILFTTKEKTLTNLLLIRVLTFLSVVPPGLPIPLFQISNKYKNPYLTGVYNYFYFGIWTFLMIFVYHFVYHFLILS